MHSFSELNESGESATQSVFGHSDVANAIHVSRFNTFFERLDFDDPGPPNVTAEDPEPDCLQRQVLIHFADDDEVRYSCRYCHKILKVIF